MQKFNVQMSLKHDIHNSDCSCATVREIKHYTTDLVRAKQPTLNDHQLRKVVANVMELAADEFNTDKTRHCRSSIYVPLLTADKDQIKKFITTNIDNLMSGKKVRSTEKSAPKLTYIDFMKRKVPCSTPNKLSSSKDSPECSPPATSKELINTSKTCSAPKKPRFSTSINDPKSKRELLKIPQSTTPVSGKKHIRRAIRFNVDEDANKASLNLNDKKRNVISRIPKAILKIDNNKPAISSTNIPQFNDSIEEQIEPELPEKELHGMRFPSNKIHQKTSPTQWLFGRRPFYYLNELQSKMDFQTNDLVIKTKSNMKTPEQPKYNFNSHNDNQTGYGPFSLGSNLLSAKHIQNGASYTDNHQVANTHKSGNINSENTRNVGMQFNIQVNLPSLDHGYTQHQQHEQAGKVNDVRSNSFYLYPEMPKKFSFNGNSNSFFNNSAEAQKSQIDQMMFNSSMSSGNFQNRYGGVSGSDNKTNSVNTDDIGKLKVEIDTLQNKMNSLRLLFGN